jgi:uncharacterized protein YdeI (YjbR/CyaY-like superfamily)
MNTESVDAFLRDGCGRCDKYRTPACKVHQWSALLVALRALLRDAGLAEELKWGHPCYAADGHNVALLGAWKDRCTLSFVEGAALADDDGLLEVPGPNSHRARLVAFRSVEELEARREGVGRLLSQAIALAREGRTVAPRAERDPVPEELERVLAAAPAVRAAFDALTPGRQRSHVLFVTGAKGAATRARRAERCATEILAGRGWQERDR